MATLYSIENILVTREDASGDVLATPTVLQLCLTEDTVKESKSYEDLKCLLKEGVTKIEGKSTVEGSWKFKMEANTLAFTMTHTLGERESLADATAETWTLSTAYVVGDQVNTVDGLWTLTVVKVSGAGTSGATEPTITSKGERIVDNEVVWLAEPKLLTMVFPLSVAVPTFTAEISLRNTTDDTIWYKQYRHLELDKLPVTIDAESNYEISVDPKGGLAVDEDSSLWTMDLMSIAGAVLVKAESEFFGGDCELTSVLIDDAVDDTDSIDITVDKGLTTVDLLNCRTSTDRDVTASGTLMKSFSPTEYDKFKIRTSFDAKVNLSTKSGSSCNYHFPQVVPEFADPDRESKTKVMISPNINAEEVDATTPLVTVTITVPSMIDGTNTIVGSGAY